MRNIFAFFDTFQRVKNIQKNFRSSRLIGSFFASSCFLSYEHNSIHPYRLYVELHSAVRSIAQDPV